MKYVCSLLMHIGNKMAKIKNFDNLSAGVNIVNILIINASKIFKREEINNQLIFKSLYLQFYC